MTTKQKAEILIGRLSARYPDPQCGLYWEGDVYRLLIMAILSAQCTDERVNAVSKDLFKKYPTVFDLAKADLTELENDIRSIGLFRSKARAIKETAISVVDNFGGSIPSSMDDLLTLRGVGRKVANLIRGDAFSLGGIVADTHCIRICHRLGFTKKPTPEETEKVMSGLIPVGEQCDFCHRAVLFGREVCNARSPGCADCELKEFCRYFSENDKQ